MKRLSDLGEDPLVERLVRLLDGGPKVVVGPGDDCAVLQSGHRGRVDLLKTDCLVEGIHYTSATPPAKVGWKAVARVLSDFAAMGGHAEHLLVTTVLPPDRELRWAEQLYRGMNRCSVRFGATIVGGETSSVPVGAPAMISVAASGFSKKKQLVLRSGGRVGDEVFVTGRLGGSIHGKHLSFTPRLVEAEWLTSKFRLHAMMDLSDGLAKDLPRLAHASNCGFLLEREALPRTRGVTTEQALGDGEDYELLFTVSKRTAQRIEAQWPAQFPKLKLTRIASLHDGESTRLVGGWDHFAR